MLQRSVGADVGVECWSGVLEWSVGAECWSGVLEWSVGAECWSGVLEWSFGVEWSGVKFWSENVGYFAIHSNKARPYFRKYQEHTGYAAIVNCRESRVTRIDKR